MIVNADLTLNSGNRFQVEIHSIQSDSLGKVHRGKFKNSSSIKKQLDIDARDAGSWRALREMTIEFNYRDINYKYPIIVDVPVVDFGDFKVIGENVA